jgi:hypothetical protein
MKSILCVGFVALATIAFGCKQGPAGNAPGKGSIEGGLRTRIPILDRTLTQTCLRNLDFGFKASPGATPKTVEELEQIHGDRRLTKAINDGQITVILGVSPDRQPGEAILAYQTEPDAQGERVVLTCGGSLLVMDKATFEATPKAQAR